jgi:hypothetical protein
MGKPERKGRLGIPRLRRLDSIKTVLGGKGMVIINWVDLA